MTTQRPTTDTADVQAPQAAPEPAVAPQGTAAPGGQRSAFDVTDLNLFYGGFHAVKDVNMAIERNKVTAFIGSSGCGKSTVLRSLNRMHEVILMDEPCSALDPISTLAIEDLIEELIHDLKQRYTIVIVTHNMQQAARVADTTAFFLNGEMIEHAPTDRVFSNPDDERTEQYVTGKFG